ncbi:MAG: UDP-N-acetylmuramoylalanyl-D-glutamyl-2,6-diaminopimelate--D-alanyl-D-alanine ligase [Hyphomicrobiales bacterium]|nr:UDP-N-acetylmuramoylalanyl-D-glutamyl-2,6-diaminopimelate--D-alanyl-D-alanine ligase [Hyphomicrobiales bacterium]
MGPAPNLLWTLGDAIAACDGWPEGEIDPDAPICSVSIDSRTALPNALFVAIRGDNLDGHDYIAKAFASGATAALVAEDAGLDAAAAQGPLIRVSDTLKGMERLAKSARARSHAAVIAVTGSVGKTGTKEALRLALGPSGSVHASAKSHNNHWGVPLSLANMAPDVQFGVFEVGMNHAGEITPLTAMVRPQVAIVTTVEPVHLEFFASVAEIAEAKAEIFSGLDRDGTAIVNRDNAHFELLARRAQEAGARRVVSFGEHEEADARLVQANSTAGGSDVWARICGEAVSYRIGAPGRHLVMNSLAVLAAVQAAGADLRAGAQALKDYQAQTGRGARATLEAAAGKVLLIDESYNANPVSMAAALATLGSTPRRKFARRIAVLGDMLELGETSAELHRKLAEPVDAAGIDVVFACGPHMHALFEALPEDVRGAYAETSDGLRAALLDTVEVGDVVMVKGSLGSKMGVLVKALREHFAR